MTNVRQFAGAVAVGAMAAAVLAFNPRIVLAAGVGVVAIFALPRLVDLGGQRLAGVAWAAAAITAPFNGVRLSSVVALSDVFLLLAVAGMLPSIALGRRTSLGAADNGVIVGLALIAAGGLIGAAVAVHPIASLTETAKFVVAAGGSVVAMRMWGPNSWTIRRFCSLWLLGAVISAAWALTFSAKVVGRPLGLSTHPNHLAIVCLLATAMALGFALGGSPLARRLSLCAFVPLVLALVASGSRAALLGFFVMVPTVAVLAYRVQLAVRAVAVAAVLGVAVMAGVVHVPADTGLGRLFGGASSLGSDASRVEHLGRSIARFERHPLTGEGFEFAQEAHNIYVQILVAAGPVGLIGLVLAVGTILKVSWHGARARPGRALGDHALLAGLGGGYAGYLVAGLFQNILWDRYLWLYVAALLSLAAVVPVGRGSRARPLDRLPGASRAVEPAATPSTPGIGSSR